MEPKIIDFTVDVDRYRKIAEEYAEKGEYLKALGFLMTAKNECATIDVISDIADCYADMGLMELSNKYWFIYMDKAPKERVSVAYEELAINFFYMDNFLASGYYFHLKLNTDGFISKEGLDKEIIDFFSGEERRRSAYRIAYPFDRADYSYNSKNGKHAMAVGNFEEAVKIISSIPEECLDEDTAGDLAVSLFMTDRLDDAATVCRNSLSKHGDNVTAYSNLSTVYDMKEDFEKSEYYYKKALECSTGAKNEEYKIATCAIERKDHLMVKKCLEKILDERTYDLSMTFFYGMALANLGDYDGAYKAFSKAYKINPCDTVCKFFAEYFLDFSKEGDTKNILPLKYVKNFPEKIEKSYKKQIKNLVQNPEKIKSALKKSEVCDMLSWGLYSAEKETVRGCAFILSTVFTPYAKKVMLEALLDNDANVELKRVLIYALIVNGYKERFGVVAGSFHFKIKPRKLLFERQVDGGLYLSAYALCMSRVAFWEVEDLDKVGFTANAIYKKFSGKITEAEISNEELAALILSECKFKRFETDKEVMGLFEIKKSKLETLKKLLRGE